MEENRKVILNNVFPNAGYMTTYDNIGHETINLFKADDGYYIYLNANGTYDKKDDYVDVINLAYVSNGLYKVISKAVDCCVFNGANFIGKKSEKRKERFNRQKEAIYYDGIPIYKFFEQNRTMKGLGEKDLFVTFKAVNGIYEPNQNIYVAFKNCKSLAVSNNIYRLKDVTKFSSACRIEKLSKNDQNVLFEMIDNNDIWKKDPIVSFVCKIKELNGNRNNGENYFTFLGVEKSELAYSNALAKILNFNPKYVISFLGGLLKEDSFSNNHFEILREEKNIDILFRDLDKTNGKIVIIENKIDASITMLDTEIDSTCGIAQELIDKGIDSLEAQIDKYFCQVEGIKNQELKEKPEKNQKLKIKHDRIRNLISGTNSPSQLSKYYIIAVCWAVEAGWDDKKIKNDIYCYFLCPEYHKLIYKTKGYNRLDIGLACDDKYTLITYKDILDIFNLDIFKKLYEENLTQDQKFLYDGFLSAISSLAKERDDSMELKMIRMFIDRYNEIKAEQKNNELT